MEWLRPLARWATDGTAASQAGAARENAASAVLDWFGAYYAGAGNPMAAPYMETETALGAGNTPGLPEQAWLTAALSHLEEIDDGHRLAMLHPGVVVMPAVLCLAARSDLQVRSILTAIAIGYECAVRVGAALGPEHYKRHHSSATAGAFGSAAAAGSLLRLDEEKMMWAFGHAGTQAAGLWQFLDDGAEEAKAAHIGHAVRNGLYAAVMADKHIPGATRIIEGARGLARASRITADQGKLVPPKAPGDLAIATATTKAWPVCGQMHHILDAVDHIVRAQAISVEEIQSLTIRSYDATVRIAGIREPNTIAQARFSTPFCVALLLVTGRLDLTNLTAQSLDAEPVRSLASRVHLEADDRFTAVFPARRACHVQLLTKSGQKHELEHEGRRGDPEQPLSKQEMSARFEAAAHGQPSERREAVRALVARLAEDDPASVVPPAQIASLLNLK